MKFLNIKWNNREFHLWAEQDKETVWIHFQGALRQWKAPAQNEAVGEEALSKKPSARLKEEEICALMPGRIVKIPFKKGMKVKKGDVLLTLSAMKMEYNFKAASVGRVEEVFCKENDQAGLNQVLLRVKYTDPSLL